MLTINSVAPTIMRFGSEEQKQFYVPKILKGEIHFAIGYTEPDAGTDLASLKTTAVRDGDEYVINGQKVFTSLASGADYIWLAVRTNQEVKKHKGISIIIVPTDTPGFRYVPIDNFGATNTNITYYEDVRVPVGNLVGEENGGWGLITNQLNHERVTLCSSGVVERMLDDVRGWAQETKLADGRRVIDQEWVQVNLARVHAKLEFLRLANWRVAWLAQSGAALNPADASTIKVYGTEFYMEAARLLMEVMRDQATLQGDSPGRGAARPGRADAALDAHPHVRRRHQRDAARPDRDLRAQHARQPALIAAIDWEHDDDGLCPHRDARGAARPRGAHPRGPHRPPAPEGARPLRRLVRPPHVAGVREGEPARHRAAGVGRRSRLRLPRPLHGAARGRPQRRRRCPAIPTLVAGALPIAQFGSDAQQAILAKVASGDVLLTAALVEIGAEPREADHDRDARRRRLAHQRHEVERARRDRGRARARAGDGRRRGSRCSSCRRTRRASRRRASRR